MPEDPSLAARVIARAPLRYAAGASEGDDRPAHVRAGSALVRIGPRLAVVQDDAAFVAVVARDGADRAAAIALPDEAGVRCFDDTRGNKAKKLDLEAAIAIGNTLIAFGSGSTPARERVVLVRGVAGEHARVEVIDASRFYAALRAETRFAGSELNVEGAAIRGRAVVLFQRGNAASRDAAVDATGEVGLQPLLAFLEDPRNAPVPSLADVKQWQLGAIEGVRLTFTDGAARGEQLFFLAAAEDSPDTYRDGPIAGVAIGVLGEEARWARLTDERGEPVREKAEGLVLDGRDESRAWVVVDRDDPAVASELWTVELSGAW